MPCQLRVQFRILHSPPSRVEGEGWLCPPTAPPPAHRSRGHGKSPFVPAGAPWPDAAGQRPLACLHPLALHPARHDAPRPDEAPPARLAPATLAARLPSRRSRRAARPTPTPPAPQVNLFKDNGTVVHFNNPKVQASIAANTYVVSGQAETKKLQELLPGIINQLGPDNLANLKKIAESYQAGGPGQIPTGDAEDDEDVPDLVDNFEETAAK